MDICSLLCPRVQIQCSLECNISRIFFAFVDANDITTVESLQFDFVTVESATNKFSEDNKLGEGGFGQVYKVCN